MKHHAIAGAHLVAPNERLKIEIPGADYRKLGTLEQIVDYLSTKAR